jgi:hypothetical protein
MSQSMSAKASKVAEARERIVDHLKSLPEPGKCEDEDFVIWGRKFLEIKVRRYKHCFIFF